MASRAPLVVITLAAILVLGTLVAAPAQVERRDFAQSWDVLLEHCDANHDGQISRAEFTGPDDAFKAMDGDGDGVLTRDESQLWGPAFVVAAAFIAANDAPVAMVNNVTITQGQLDRRMTSAVGRDILKDMIDRELIRQAAEEAGLRVSDEELASEFARRKLGFPSEEAFGMFLASRNITEEQWLDEVRVALIARALTLKDVTYTDEDLRAFFEQHKDVYSLPLRVSLSEIVLGTREEADRIMAALRVSPNRFGELARAYSLSPYSKQNDGRRPSEMRLDQVQIPAIQDVLIAQPVGEITGPIEVTVGGQPQWHIIRVDERKPPHKGSFEEDRDKVLESYQAAHAKPLRDIIREMAERSEVVVVDPRFQDLTENYSPDAE